MPRKKPTNQEAPVKRMRPALTPEARENQMIALAIDCAERQMREGTASSQVITHYLKLGSMREKLEREKLEEENKLLRAKTENIESGRRSAEFYNKVLAAYLSYSGQEMDEDDQDIF